MDIVSGVGEKKVANEIIVDFPFLLKDKEKKMIYGYKGDVVRCKDCKHYWKNSTTTDAPLCLASPKDDAFCSEAERIKYEID